VVLDLLQVVHLDSTALRSQLSRRRLASERDATLVLVCGQGSVLQVLDVTGLAEMFEIHPSLEDALAAIGRPNQPKC
jgi:anti-anti-sigma factor